MWIIHCSQLIRYPVKVPYLRNRQIELCYRSFDPTVSLDSYKTVVCVFCCRGDVLTLLSAKCNLLLTKSKPEHAFIYFTEREIIQFLTFPFVLWFPVQLPVSPSSTDDAMRVGGGLFWHNTRLSEIFCDDKLNNTTDNNDENRSYIRPATSRDLIWFPWNPPDGVLRPWQGFLLDDINCSVVQTRISSNAFTPN